MPRCPVCYRRIPSAKPCPRDGWLSPSLSGEAFWVDAGQVATLSPSLPGIELLRPLGAGGFSTVWEAVRIEGGAPFALKIGLGTSALTVARFRLDAGALERIGPPFVPRLHASGVLDDGRPFIAMDLLRGKTLADTLADLEAPPDAAEVAALGGAILDALAAAHDKRVIHRDLKPENLVLSEDGRRVALIDFGLTKTADAAEQAGLTGQGPIIGTPEYMAPEQLRGDPIQDARTDLYAFGVILFELLTLHLPFAGDRGAVEHGHLALRPPRPRELADVPEALEKLVLACLAKEPERRPRDAAALRLALAEALPPDQPRSGSPPDARPAPSPLLARSALLGGGRQPAILLVTEAGSESALVMTAVTARKGFIARQRGSRLGCVFSGLYMEDPLGAAIAVAREVAGRRTARVALHLAELTLRRKDQGPPAVHGAPIEHPDTWLPPGDWDGIVLTTDIVRAMPESELSGVALDPTLSGAPGAVFYRLAGRSDHPSPAVRAVPLLGRDDVMNALGASLSASVIGACPGLFTLLGDVGLGKSRLADEAAALVRRAHPDARILVLRASQPLAGDERARASRQLLASVLEVNDQARPDDPRAFCQARLGEQLGDEVWKAVSAALGWTSPKETGVSTASLRHGTRLAIAEGLRRRARLAPVVVVLDDAHWADDTALDALEIATLDAPGYACPLWVLVTAYPRFEGMRRSWGLRAERHDRVSLGRLSERGAMSLAAELLRPAEYPPEAALRQLASWSGYNPSCLAELIRALKRAGLVQQRPSGSAYVTTAMLERLPPLPAWQWLAARRLDALSPELAACLRLCSVLGSDFTRDEVEQIQDAIEPAGGAGTPIDAGVGLSALADAGLLGRAEGGLYSFQDATFRDAVYDALAPAQRRILHRHAFAWWRARVGSLAADRRGIEHLARHAGACGERGEAAAASVALGDRALASHENVEADQRYTAALALLDEDDAEGATRRRALALAGRGKARYRMHRMHEALADLALACELGRTTGDDRLTAELLLEEATALDHATDFAASAQRAEEARPLALRLGDPRIESRSLMALGRSCWRQQRVAEALDLLGCAASGAAAGGDLETRVIALLLLSIALVVAGRLDEAEARFCEVIDLCGEMNDRLHLCSAFANRAYLWAAQSAPERGLEDLRRAVELAREIGNPEPEHVATHNLAELLHWCGREEEALALARRSRVLQERFAERAAPEDALLVARIQAARGDLQDAASLVGWIAERCPPDPSAPTVHALFRMLKLVLAAGGIEAGDAVESVEDDWEALAAFAERSLPVEELLEVLYWCVRAHASADRLGEASIALERARPRLLECSLWRPRFDALAALVLPAGASSGAA